MTDIPTTQINLPIIPGKSGRYLITVVNGILHSFMPLLAEHHVATLESLIELLRAAGYTVSKD